LALSSFDIARIGLVFEDSIRQLAKGETSCGDEEMPE
jgi:hypothetical protein